MKPYAKDTQKDCKGRDKIPTLTLPKGGKKKQPNTHPDPPEGREEKVMVTAEFGIKLAVITTEFGINLAV
ncbi:MAG: hypothetical protein IKT00_05970 [Prevotella sp.]|nr:hypothetical protein [Prevotella sp.]